jgi:hypothetical protein
MRNIGKAFFGSAFMLMAQGCAHYGEALKSELSPWLGQHPDRLVEQWGAPNSFYAMENGVKVLSYFNDRQVTRSTGVGYSAWRWGNYSYSETCKINFFTDATQKKIERYSTSGTDSSCVEVIRDIPKSPK